MAEKVSLPIPGSRQEIEHEEHHAAAEARPAQREKRADGLGHLRVQAPPGTIVVEPGGKSFRTFKEALDSITDAGPSSVYMLNCGMGTWEEQVILKPYVNITGTLDQSTQEQLTYIRCRAFKPGTPSGVIVAASNSSIVQCLINSYAVEAGTNAVGISCDGTDPFAIADCRVESYNTSGFTLNAAVAISVDFIDYSKKGTSNVGVEYTDVVFHNVPDTDDYPVALGAGGNAKIMVDEGSLSASARDHAAGAVAYDTCNIRFNFTKVTGNTWSLIIWGNSAAAMTAYKCTLTGPVDPRVKIIN